MPFGILRCLAFGWVLLTVAAHAEQTALFNGKDLSGWTYHPEPGAETLPAEAGQPWIVDRGLLVSRGIASGYLLHEKQLEDYVLTLEWRCMRLNGNGVAVSGSGSVYIHTSAEQGRFHAPKSIEVPLDQIGAVFFRDVEDLSDTDKWAHQAPDFADEVEHEMGEWNRLKLITRGNKLTVFVNGRAVSQIEPLNRTRGAIGLKSSRGFFPAPLYYRNLVVRSIGAADLEAERQAAAALRGFKLAEAQQRAAEQAQAAAEEQLQLETQQQLSGKWASSEVKHDIPFAAAVTQLPFPPKMRELEFDATFDDVSFESPWSLAQLSDFYRTEMARRGWQVTETDIEEDEVEVTFQLAESQIVLNLDQSSDGVDVSLDCEGLSFAGTDDPRALVGAGIPQPRAYLILQRELELPPSYQDHEFESGDSRSFKSSLPLPELYRFLTDQLRQKGYRETRRPIINSGRQYSEFAKGRDTISVNAFTHAIGSRVRIEYEGE